LNANADPLPKSPMPQRGDIQDTTRHVTWLEDEEDGDQLEGLPGLVGDGNGSSSCRGIPCKTGRDSSVVQEDPGRSDEEAPPLGEEEELYDDFFWEAPPGEKEAESDDRERQTIILEPTEQTARGTMKEAVLLKWH